MFPAIIINPMRGLRSADLTNVLQYQLHQSAGTRSCRRDVRIATEKKLTNSAEFRVAKAKFSFVLIISAAVSWEEFVSSGGSQRLD